MPCHLLAELARTHGVDKHASTFTPWVHGVTFPYAKLAHALSRGDYRSLDSPRQAEQPGFESVFRNSMREQHPLIRPSSFKILLSIRRASPSGKTVTYLLLSAFGTAVNKFIKFKKYVQFFSYNLTLGDAPH